MVLLYFKSKNVYTHLDDKCKQDEINKLNTLFSQSVKTENNLIEETQQLSLFNDLSQEEQVVVDKLKRLNVFEMNPIDAMKVLYELQQQLQK